MEKLGNAQVTPYTQQRENFFRQRYVQEKFLNRVENKLTRLEAMKKGRWNFCRRDIETSLFWTQCKKFVCILLLNAKGIKAEFLVLQLKNNNA